MKRFLTSIVVAVSLAMNTMATVPPRTVIYDVMQSDGTSLTIYNVTTPERTFFRTADGYLVDKNDKGDYCYVSAIDGDNCVLTATLAHNNHSRSFTESMELKDLRKAFDIIDEVEGKNSFKTDNKRPGMKMVGLHDKAALTSVGSPKVPVVLVQFNDKSFTSASADQINETYNKYCNGDGVNEYFSDYSYGSVKEYFRDQSNGQFTPEFKVIGPVTLSKSYTYYGKNSGTRKDVNIQALYSEAIKLAQEQISDWTEFDNNGDNIIDMVFFVYAGEGENAYSKDSVELIWPKESPSGGTINEVKYGCYACCNETYKGDIDGIGTFCHELSHALGLSDHYDYKAQDYGMESWDIMDYGNYMNNGRRPVGYTGYEKDFMQWQSFVQLSPDKPQMVTLKPLSDYGESYKITNPANKDEYYWLENRQNDSWDYNVGYSLGSINEFHHGMLICHVDYLQSAWTANNINYDSNHQRMTVIPAGGRLWPQYHIGKEGYYDIYEYLDNQATVPFPGALGIKLLADDAAVVYQGGTMGQPIRDIEEIDGIITFKYCITEQLDAPVINTDYITETLNWNDVEGATEYWAVIATDENFTQCIDTIKTNNASALVSIKQYAPEGTDDIDLYVKVQARAELLLNSDFSNTVHINKTITALDRVMDETAFSNAVVEVFTMSGAKVAEGKMERLSKLLDNGVYLVKTGSYTKKIHIHK